MKDAVADDGDAFMRVCRMYTTINHRGIAYTTINHRGTVYTTINHRRAIAYTTINGVLQNINRGSDAKHGVAIDSNAV